MKFSAHLKIWTGLARRNAETILPYFGALLVVSFWVWLSFYSFKR